MAAGRSAWRIGKTRTLVAKTCCSCDELKDGDQFRRRPDGYYQAACKRCHHISAKVSGKRTNSKSQEHATKSKQPWTTKEVKDLGELLKENHHYSEIAKRLGRSVNAITIAKLRFYRED